jgi:uncharacterized protein
MKALIDTSFLLATLHKKDKYYRRARRALRKSKGERFIVASVLSELFYMAKERVSYNRAVEQFESITSAGFTIVDLTAPDFTRMSEIMHQYGDNKFDYVDVSIMAVSERLNIKQIYTFDHRDFSVFRPQHCDYLELLP